MSLLLTGAFSRVEVDRRVAESSGATIAALAIAQSGLQRYLGDSLTGTANPSSLCPPGRPLGAPADGDSVRINVTGGYADVVAQLLQHPADSMAPRKYLVRSTGHLLDPTQGADPQAVRTVAQFAEWQTGAMDQIAGLTAINGLFREPGNNKVTINGNDNYSPPGPGRYGLRTPAGQANISSNGHTNLFGTPVAVFDQDTTTVVAGLTHINWPAIVNGDLAPDYTTFTPVYTYPITIIQGDLSTPVQVSDGTGLLVVTGDLTLRGPLFIWHGIVLVGGALRDSTTGTGAYLTGATVTGLNAQLGATVLPTVVGSGTGAQGFKARYNTCYVRTALAQLTGFVPVSNAWVDNWATY